MMIRSSSTIVLLLVTFVLAALTPQAAAWEWYLGLLPNGHNVKRNGVAWLGVGHNNHEGGSQTLNPFGADFEEAHFVWTKTLCEKDSDGDGVHNGAELGDPDCDWTQGKRPARQVDISHPGFADSVPQQPSWKERHHDAVSAGLSVAEAGDL
jgi:dopamine beta-monooxygenase